MEEGLADGLGEHALAGHATDSGDCRRADRLIARGDEQPGLGAELSSAEGEGTNPALGDRRTPLRSRLRGDEHRVDAAELAVERDRTRTVSGEARECESPALAAGEGHRFDAIVVDKVDAVPQLVRHHREHAARCTRIGKCLLRDRHDRVTQPRVAGIGLDHDRAARRKR